MKLPALPSFINFAYSSGNSRIVQEVMLCAPKSSATESTSQLTSKFSHPSKCSEAELANKFKQSHARRLDRQIEPDIHFRSDDGTLHTDSTIAGWGQMMIDVCAVLGKPLNIADTFRSRITNFTSPDGGKFQSVQQKIYKVPYGTWTRHPVLKEVGRINKDHFLEGMEGYAMLVLTKFGRKEGKPWSPEEVKVFLNKVRGEMEGGGIRILF